MPLSVYGGLMIDFLTGCASLFTATFNAACEVDFFELLFGYIVLQTGLWVFCGLNKGLRKM